MLKVGDPLTLIPSVYGSKDLIEVVPRPCRVVYIHPLRRFFVVEFFAELTARPGGKRDILTTAPVSAGRSNHEDDSNF